jgi:effector-binding domain-containing protein
MRTGLSTEPRIIERSAQPYVAIKKLVTMQTISEIADQLPEVFGWLAARGLEPSSAASAPFLKYNVCYRAGLLEVEAGLPVASIVPGDDRVLAGVLPGGRFASVTHVGHPSGLVEATAALLDWGAELGLDWDLTETNDGQTWGLRLELYKTNPTQDPDLSKWETEIVFRLADVEECVECGFDG